MHCVRRPPQLLWIYLFMCFHPTTIWSFSQQWLVIRQTSKPLVESHASVCLYNNTASFIPLPKAFLSAEFFKKVTVYVP